MSLPLAGARLVMTRPATERSALSEALHAAGAETLEFPAMALCPSSQVCPAGAFDLVVFTSPAAVDFGLKRLNGRLPERVAAPGTGTASQLRDAGVEAVIIPPEGAGVAALLEAPELSGRLSGWRVLVVAGSPLNRHGLDLLREVGACPEVFCAYERKVARDPQPLASWLAQNGADAIMVSSVTAVKALTALPGLEWSRVDWIVSSPRVGTAVAAAGGRLGAVAASAETRDMVCAAIDWWSARTGAKSRTGHSVSETGGNQP